MTETYAVAVLVGSLRKDSLNRKMAKALAAMAPETIRLEIVEIGDLPHFNQDDEANPGPAVLALKQKIRSADAVLFVTPEYNRSIPGVLKNALDCASRPSGQNAFDGKPAGVISVSPGAIGGFGANQHLRQCLVALNMPVLQQPEAYIGGAAKMFDEQEQLTSDTTREFLRKFLTAFEEWIGRTGAKDPIDFVPPARAASGAAAQRRN
jgi:chromate reductase